MVYTMVCTTCREPGPWYIPWYVLLVGNLDLLLPHGIYHGIYQVFGICYGIYRSQGVIYHGIYKFDLFLPHSLYQFGWYIAWYVSFFWYIAWYEIVCNRVKVGFTYGIYLKVVYTVWGVYHANYDIFHAIKVAKEVCMD